MTSYSKLWTEERIKREKVERETRQLREQLEFWIAFARTQNAQEFLEFSCRYHGVCLLSRKMIMGDLYA